MKYALSLLLGLFLFSACSSTYEKTELYGHWKNNKWQFVFNEDGSCKVGDATSFQSGEWRYTTFVNTLEIIRDGKVFLSNLTVKGIENDELTLEFRQLVGSGDQMDNLQVLKRVK